MLYGVVKIFFYDVIYNNIIYSESGNSKDQINQSRASSKACLFTCGLSKTSWSTLSSSPSKEVALALLWMVPEAAIFRITSPLFLF
jgi:hypothetical protein